MSADGLRLAGSGEDMLLDSEIRRMSAKSGQVGGVGEVYLWVRSWTATSGPVK